MFGSGSQGGTSFDGGTNPQFSLAAAPGDGSVTISLVATSSVPEPASFALFGTGVLGLLALRRRKRV